MPLTAGTKLGHYEIVALLGIGGMGEVYRARDPKLCRDVALKIMRRDSRQVPFDWPYHDFVSRFFISPGCDSSSVCLTDEG